MQAPVGRVGGTPGRPGVNKGKAEGTSARKGRLGLLGREAEEGKGGLQMRKTKELQGPAPCGCFLHSQSTPQPSSGGHRVGSPSRSPRGR